MTLVGYKNLRTKRRNISVIVRDISRPDWFSDGHLDKDIILINHSKQILVNPMELPDAEEKLAILNDITRVDPVQGDLEIMNYEIRHCKTWLGKPVITNINGYSAGKFAFKVNAKMGYKKKGRSFLVDSEQEYFNDAEGVALKPDFAFVIPGIEVEDEETKVHH